MTASILQLLSGGLAGGLTGGLAGYFLGCGVWVLFTFYTNHYASQGAAANGTAVAPTPKINTGASSALAWIVRLALAGWGAVLIWGAPGPASWVPGLLITGLLVTIMLVDFQTRRIPNALVLALLGWAAVQLVWPGQLSLRDAGLGLLVGGGSFFLLALIGRGAMGIGDVKLAAALGALLGYPLILPALLGGVLAGGIGAVALLVTRRAGRKDSMAYGPYLALGAWLVLVNRLGVWPL